MLIGKYQYSLDKKNRLFIPTRFREGTKKFFLATGLERCLFVFPPPYFKQLLQKLESLPLTKSEARGFTRMFLSGAIECNLDKQGRILIPQHLLKWAELKKETVIIGMLNRLEVWAQNKWKIYEKKSLQDYTRLADKLVETKL